MSSYESVGPSSYPLRVETSPPPPPRRTDTFTSGASLPYAGRDTSPAREHHDRYSDEDVRDEYDYYPGSPGYAPTRRRRRSPSPSLSPHSVQIDNRASIPGYYRPKVERPISRIIERSLRYKDGKRIDRGGSDVVIRRSRTLSPPGPLVLTRFPAHAAPYSFVPSRTGVGSKSSSSKSLENDDPPESDPKDAAADSHGPGVPAYHVLSSEYDGEGHLGGRHGVQLTTVVSPEYLARPLFRWIHLTRQLMDFDEFSTQALQVPGLTSSEKKGLSDMIATIKREHIKSIQTSRGSYVGHMEPRFIQNRLPPGGSPSEQTLAPRTVTWICLPYFTLERYSGLLAADNPRLFPMQTLLQAQFSGATRDRDMQQAVRQRKGSSEVCFHIAQLWCLILDNSLLLTCGRMSEDTLRGESIKVAVRSAQSLSTAAPEWNPVLSVRYKGDVVWSIPVDECQTWFRFLAHFRDFWPNSLQFFRHKQLVTAEDWPKLHNLASHAGSRVVLDFQLGPLPRPSSIGVLGPLDVAEPAQEGAEAQGLKAQPTDQKPTTGGASTAQQPGKKKSGATKGKPLLDPFAVFSCLEGIATSTSFDPQALADHFAEVDEYLKTKTASGDRRAYNDCETASRVSVHRLLELEGNQLADPAHGQPTMGQQSDYEKRVSLFNTACAIFIFFFPAETEVPTTGKFWGGVQTLVKDPSASPSYKEPEDRRHRDRGELRLVSTRSLDSIQSVLRDITIDLLSFNEIFVHAEQSDRAKITTPLSLIDAWMHLVLALITLPNDRIRSESLIWDAEMLLKRGLQEMIAALPGKSLSKSSIVLPLELVSLMSKRLLKGVAPGLGPETPRPPDISATYSSSLSGIEASISNNSKLPDRRHEHNLSLLKQEMSIVQWTIETQQSIFRGMLTASKMLNPDPGDVNPVLAIKTEGGLGAPGRRHYESRAATEHAHVERVYNEGDMPYHGPTTRVVQASMSGSDIGSFRHMLIYECLQYLGRREREFSEMRIHASLLEEENQNKVSRTKDRQERAIYAFTIVTVIFLPLSAVASIFGMNSADIRDMEVGQWAYWATAVPVTVLVVFLGLLFTGELGNALRWVMSFGGGSASVGATAHSGGGVHHRRDGAGYGHDYDYDHERERRTVRFDEPDIVRPRVSRRPTVSSRRQYFG